MKLKLLAVAVAVTLAVPAAAIACEGEGHAEAANEPKKITVADLAKNLTAKKSTPVDANNADFRAKNGVIPGAILLTSSSGFDAAKELPKAKDTELVFYCANTMCGASHAAAYKAIQAGYTNVKVLPDGLMGWKNAGQKTANAKPQS
jgi:rhodanese-related sulfurtransferase